MAEVISESFISNLKDSVSISSYVSKFIKLNPIGNGKFRGLCPFHKEKTPSFVVDSAQNFFHCFGCGMGGDIITFAKEINNYTFLESVKNLAEENNIELPKESSGNKVNDKNILFFDIFSAAKKLYHCKLMSNDIALNYLKKTRGLSDEVISYFNLGFASNGSLLYKSLSEQYGNKDLIKSSLVKEINGQNLDFFYNRIVIPICDNLGRCVSFGARAIDNNIKPKYLNTAENPIFKKNNILFNFDKAKSFVKHNKMPFILVEGYMDVIKMAQHGFYNGVAPLGTAVSILQISKIMTSYVNPIVCFNNDFAGQKAMFKVAQIAIGLMKDPKISVSFIVLKDFNDIDEMFMSTDNKNDIQDKFKKLLDNAISLYDFAWQYISKDCDLDNPHSLAMLFKACKSFTQNAKDKDIEVSYNSFFKLKIKELIASKNINWKQKTVVSNIPKLNIKHSEYKQVLCELFFLLIIKPDLINDQHKESYVELISEDFIDILITIEATIDSFFSQSRVYDHNEVLNALKGKIDNDIIDVLNNLNNRDSLRYKGNSQVVDLDLKIKEKGMLLRMFLIENEINDLKNAQNPEKDFNLLKSLLIEKDAMLDQLSEIAFKMDIDENN